MSTSTVRQDRPGAYQPVALTPEEDAERIKKLRASRGSHHTAGGCAEGQTKASSSYKRMVSADLL